MRYRITYVTEVNADDADTAFQIFKEEVNGEYQRPTIERVED